MTVMKSLPIRMRLALWYLASFFVVLMLFGGGVFYAMRASIQEDFDRDLKMRLRGLGSFVETQFRSTRERMQGELRERAEVRPGGELVQISDGEGRWLFQSESMRNLDIPMTSTNSAKPTLSTVVMRDHPFRLITGFKQVGNRRYGIQLAQSLEESSELVGHFGWILGACIPIVLLVAGFIGYWMARRALQPVITITEDARAITALDISKRIAVPAAKDELRSLSTTLNEMLGRLEAAFHRVTQFTADASHELRTPVALIRTTAELAMAEQSPQSWLEALSSILEESEQTTVLIEDLLLLARADANVHLRQEPLDVAAVVDTAMRQVGVLARAKNISLNFDSTSTGHWMNGNSKLLRRLFLILADNAIKYTRDGGQIHVKLEHEGESVHFEIRDTGVGISSEDLPHIFERFYRADKARDRSGGAGLGLSIAEWIAKVHHGTIKVTSAVDEGTGVTVRFPSMQEPWPGRTDRQQIVSALQSSIGTR